MLTKLDLTQISNILGKSLKTALKNIPTNNDLNKALKPIEEDISTLKSDVSTLKSDVSTLKSDVSTLKKDVREIKDDTNDIKIKINEFAVTSLEISGNLLEWTDEIYRTIVKEKLPERVKKLEQIIKTS